MMQCRVEQYRLTSFDFATCLAGEDHVFGAQIAMNDALLMGLGERTC